MSMTGIITFHAAHNYGSVLQSYALSKTLSDLGFYNEIINFRSDAQKEQYKPLTKRIGVKYIFKNMYFLLNLRSRVRKYKKFEKFISEKLNKSSQEYNTLEKLYEMPPYDNYISGSDQIWNTVPYDASIAYFLPFVKEGSRRISYAASFGGVKAVKITDEITDCLKKYDIISVRESEAVDFVKDITGKEPCVMVDPTLLVERSHWEQMAGDKPIINGDYIFFYTLFASKAMIKRVKEISRLTGMKVVISNVSNQYEVFSGFKKAAYAGPCDFLNLIKFSKLNLVTSFHGTVFSILMHKPFFNIHCKKDPRIWTLLNMTGLVDRAIDYEDDTKAVLDNQKEIDYDVVEKAVEIERQKAFDFLKSSLL